jgi:photosystem II stability/assembly factor-like uncharacterized protein
MNNMRDCKLILSEDFGNTWRVIYDEFTNEGVYPHMKFAWCISTPAKGWIYLGYEYYSDKGIGVIKRSRDRAKTIDTIFINTGINYTIFRYIHMIDTLMGMVCDGGETLVITKDGFDTYKVIVPDVGQEIFITNVYMHSYNEFAFTSNRGDHGPYYYYTTDTGQTWHAQKLAERSVYLEKLFFVNRNLGWIACEEKTGVGDQKLDVMYKTTDGGKYWFVAYRQENELKLGLQDIAFCDEMNGIAVGKFGKCLRTTDGGNTWFQEYSYIEDRNNPEYFNIPLMMRVGYIGSKPIIGTGHVGLWTLNSYLGIESIFLNKDNNLKPFPNPASNSITIKIFCEQDFKTNIGIYNIVGTKQVGFDYKLIKGENLISTDIMELLMEFIIFFSLMA